MILVLVRVVQRELIGCVYLYPCIPSSLLDTHPLAYPPSFLSFIYFKELAHLAVGAGKPLQAADPRKSQCCSSNPKTV